MSAELDALRLKVQRILTDAFGNVQIGSEGQYILRHESTRVFVRCFETEDGTRRMIRIQAPILLGLTASSELMEYVATEGGFYFFGHMRLGKTDDGTYVLDFAHTLLGDYLDSEELVGATYAVVSTANDLDDELQPRFGGTRLHED